MIRLAVVGTLLVALVAAATARADQPAAGPLPVVRLEAPVQARTVGVRVTVGLRDCSARPTVTIVGSWRGRTGRARLFVDGIERVLSLSPRPASRRTDRIDFRRIRVIRGVARLRAVLVTGWRTPLRGGWNCVLRLPRLVGLGSAAGDAQRALLRLRSSVPIVPPTPAPQRVTATDHVWACGGGRRSSFDCGLRVRAGALVVPVPTPNPTVASPGSRRHASDPPGWAWALLALAGALAVGSIAAPAAQRSKEKTDMPDSWDKIARGEYAKEQQPISANASDLTKFGAPLAAFIVSVLAALGGWISDAPKAERVIAVAIIIAVAVGGLFYAFASDFRTRGAVQVSRLNNLSTLVEAEAKANDQVQTEANKALSEAKALQAAAEVTKRDAEQRAAAAEKEYEEAHKREVAAAKVEEAARARVAATEETLRETSEQLEKAQEALRRLKRKHDGRGED